MLVKLTGKESVPASNSKFLPTIIWDKVFKNGPSKTCVRQLLKILKGYGLLKQTISLQIFKRLFPQILLGPLLHTLSHIAY